MHDINVIISFGSSLGAQLNSSFSMRTEVDYTLFDYPDLPLILVIYFPTAKERLSLTDQRVIHVDEEDLQHGEEKIRLRIASLFHKGKSYFARQTVAARIDKRVALEFQEEHHSNMAIPGKYRYGLFERGELVSIAVFSGGRKMMDQPAEYRSFELIRFCHHSGVRVVGGLSKLIKSFIADFSPGDIVTYVDKDWSQDSSLQTIGFTAVGELDPQYMLFENGKKSAVLRELPPETELIAGESSYVKRNAGTIKMKLIL